MPTQANSPVNNLPQPSDYREGLFGCRLTRVDADTIELTPIWDDQVEVNGDYVDCSSNAVQCDAGAFLIDSTGRETASTPSASTAYYVYVSNSQTADAPSSVRLSTTLPQSQDQGALYLGNTGDAANWRYCGVVALDAASEFRDDEEARLIANQYNVKLASLRLSPNYNDGNTQTAYNFNSATWARINAGTDDTALFVSNTVNNQTGFVDASAAFVVDLQGAAAAQFGIGFDSNTQPVCAALVANGANDVTVTVRTTIETTGAAAIHTLTLLGMSGGVVSALVADFARNGAAADPIATALFGTIPT